MKLMESLKKIKELEMMMLPPIDKRFVDGTFYYDESNNFRKLRLKESGFNNDLIIQSHFNLGGVFVHKNCNPNVDDLIEKLKPQKSLKEFKFHFFSYGKKELKDILNSKRLSILFNWILENGLLIHMSSMDYFYYSIVDIVDELPDAKEAGVLNKVLKDTLYEVVRTDIYSFIDILYRYKYPNVKTEVIFDFYKEIYDFYIKRYEYNNFDPADFPKEMLRQMLKSGFKREGNGFIQNNEDYVLHEHYEMLYVNNPYNFRSCYHVFDKEPDIMKKLEQLECDYSKLLNMTFKQSEADIFIQISDAIVGFSSKLDSMIFNHDFNGISAFISSLTYKQVKLIYAYLNLVAKSDNFCILFSYSTVPEVYRSRYRYLFNLVSKVVKL